MTERTRASWIVYVLGALSAGAIAAAIIVVGPAAGSETSVSRTATAQSGVVQSTVSGSGNVQAASQLNLGFSTSGTVTHIDVTQGEQVAQGQLIARLDPQSAEVTLEQSKAALQSAEANLAKEEETDGETSAGQSSSGSGAAGANAAAAAVNSAPRGPTDTTTAPGATAPTGTTPTTTAPTTTTTPTSTTPSTKPAAATPKSSSPSNSTQTSGEGTEAGSSTSKTSISAATREANLASARAAVKSDRLTVQSDEQNVQDTKLYAPEDGTIVSLSGQVGETVSGSGTTKSSTSSSSSSGSGSASAGAAGASSASSARAGSTASAGSSGGSGSGSSSAFAVLSDLNSMQLVVALSESEVGNVKVGQIATVTVEALENSKLAAHVREVAILSTSTSGAVSYDVTFQLDQLDPGLKPGMSATAEVVVKQAEGVNVPTTAITAGAVTVIENGKQVRRRVVTGLKGNSSTIILSGLKAGEKVALPVATSTSSSSARGGTGLSRLGGLAGAGGLGGGGGGFGGGGGAAFFRGGG